MEQKRVLFVSDFDFSGSGYFNISTALCTGLAACGYDIKVLGLNYMGQQHDFPFPIIPMQSLPQVEVAINNISQMWKPDVVVVAIDINIQGRFFQVAKNCGLKYVAICALENGPLMMSWSMALSQMDKVFFISELGKDEARKVGINKAEHLVIGIDALLWRVPTPNEKSNMRKQMGFEEDETVILTVADNQERKNLWAAMEIVKTYRDANPNKKIKYVLVTRSNNSVGYKLQELANQIGISKEYLEFERGMSQRELWLLYACADVFLISSKGEGLCMPILEAFGTGVPVVGTDTGAIHELLLEDRGFLVDGYKFGDKDYFIDVWGNSKRTMIDIEKGAAMLKAAIEIGRIRSAKLAREYVESRTWTNTVLQLQTALEEILNGTQTPA